MSFSSATTAWTSPVLDGQVYGEPLEATGRVYVATENDTVYALAANTGAVLWSSHVGTPVPSGDLPCGDISPTVGITGTPVLDVARGEIFAVADELSGSTPTHVLVGLNMYTGTTLLDEAVDPPGQPTSAILQRTGLNLSNGNVVFGYGGNDGDCSTYSGWVAAAPEGGGTPGYYQAVPIGNDGAVWMGGAAPEVDGAGNIWAATGNGSSSTPYDFSDSVLELSPGLARTQYFAPSNWSFMNSHDQDLGSTAPALLSNGTVLQVGKNQTAYLMDQSSLGGNTGTGIATASVCPGAIAGGGDAVVGNVVYVPCGGGLQALQTNRVAGLGLGAVDEQQRPWAPDQRRRADLVDRRQLALRHQSFDRRDSRDARGRQPGQPFPDAVGRRWPPPGPGRRSRHGLRRLGRRSGPTVSPAVGPGQFVVLARRVGRRHLHVRQRRLLRFHRQSQAEPARRRHGTDAIEGRLLVGGLRRRHLQLRRRGFHGSMGGRPLNKPIVGMASTPDGDGYWLVASDGGIFSFGDAAFHGSMGGRPLNKPIVGMASTSDGLGYWMVASDGGIFSFGDAAFHGSMGGRPLNKPIVGMASTSDGLGYWLVASDAGIFNFGDAAFYGSAGSVPLRRPAIGLAATPDGRGYWIAASDGGIFNYGDANFSGSEGAVVLNKPVVGIAAQG